MVERTRSKIPTDDILSNLVRKQSIYFLFISEDPIPRNNRTKHNFFLVYFTLLLWKYIFLLKRELSLTFPSNPRCIPRDTILPNTWWLMKLKKEVWGYTGKGKCAFLVLVQLSEIQLTVFGMVPKMKSSVLHSQNENDQSLSPSLFEGNYFRRW